MSSTGLSVQQLSKSFPTRGDPLEVLAAVDLTLEPGQSVAVVGPSGSGKSTLLHILGTLDRPTAGTIRLAGVDPFSLAEPEMAAFRNRRIGLVFQEHHLLPQCSAVENVLIPTLASSSTPGRAAAAIAAPRLPETPAEDRARDLLTRVGLANRLDHRPAELSGGERQRVAIARALINRPLLLLADEPTGNLDQDTAAEIAGLFIEIYREQHAMLVLVTHSLPLAARMDRVFELRRGRLVQAAVNSVPAAGSGTP